VTKKRTQIQGTYSFFVYPNDLMLININIMGSEYKIMQERIKKFKIVNSNRFCNIIKDFSNLNKLYKKRWTQKGKRKKPCLVIFLKNNMFIYYCSIPWSKHIILALVEMCFSMLWVSKTLEGQLACKKPDQYWSKVL